MTEEQASQWRPISTANKTLKRILLGNCERDDGVAVCYWDAYYAPDGNGYTGGDGWVCEPCGEEYRDHYDAPTHWMPLPEPPK